MANSLFSVPPCTYKDQLSLTNLCDALHHGEHAGRVDAECDRFATKLCLIRVESRQLSATSPAFGAFVAGDSV